MHFSSYITGLAVASVAWASAPLDLYVRDSACSTPDGSGSCKSTSDCSGSGFSVAGYCPGSSDIQCCVAQSCSTSSGSGKCLATSSGCSGGSFIAGACPGPSDIQCCVSGGSSPPPSSGGSQGEDIVNDAKAEEGLPYVYGGGGCSGPSDGGFDCSGLTQYSICKAVGTEIPRTAAEQYAASNGKHLPRDQAQAGDLIFWAEGGDCSNSVEHVGIAMGSMREGYMVNAATTGTPVREQTIWTSSDGLDICPDAVRFWS